MAGAGGHYAADVRVLSWNLYHGRADPPAGRPLGGAFLATIAGWDWDVALLQEVPPWWPERLAPAAGAYYRSVLTSRNALLPLRRACAARFPDLIRSNGGGANAILVRGPIADHRWVELTRRPERRVAHGVALGDGTWVVNLHATKDPKHQTRADVDLALRSATRWAQGAPLVFGGDLNLRDPDVPGLARAAHHHVDHIYVDRLEPAGGRRLDAATLSDHEPILAELHGPL